MLLVVAVVEKAQEAVGVEGGFPGPPAPATAVAVAVIMAQGGRPGCCSSAEGV